MWQETLELEETRKNKKTRTLEQEETIKEKSGAEQRTEQRAEIKAEKAAAISEIKSQVATLSIDIAEKVLKSELKDKNSQEKFIETSLKETELN